MPLLPFDEQKDIGDKYRKGKSLKGRFDGSRHMIFINSHDRDATVAKDRTKHVRLL